MPATISIPELLSRYGLGQYAAETSGNTVGFPVRSEELPGVVASLKRDHRLDLKTVVATDERNQGRGFRIRYVFGVPKEDVFLVPYLEVDKYTQTFPSLTPLEHVFSIYETEIRSYFGLLPSGHPRPERILLHNENYPKNFHPLLKEAAWNQRPSLEVGAGEWPVFQQYEGDGVYEVPVGPVHAGIIEPGHFRFSLLGEEMLRLEPRLGYVHKGTEKLFENVAEGERVRLAERVSGDSSFHHALAYCQALEALSGAAVPEKAKALRVIFAELERLANHMNDIAFILLDTGFSFGGAHGARIRERFMQWHERLTGSRFLRGVAIPGGVTTDIAQAAADTLQGDLDAIEQDFREVMGAVDETVSVQNRLRQTGILDRDVAQDYGVVGIAARAVGIEMDARADYPYALYSSLNFSVPTEEAGDVEARFMVRVREVHQSFRLLHQALTILPHTRGALACTVQALPADAQGIGIVEGWRGDIVYYVKTDASGRIDRVKVRDASMLNWTVFPHIVGRDMLPDFPLINKSFNLSYSGNDL